MTQPNKQHKIRQFIKDLRQRKVSMDYMALEQKISEFGLYDRYRASGSYGNPWEFLTLGLSQVRTVFKGF